jgi:hypothetical protein
VPRAQAYGRHMGLSRLTRAAVAVVVFVVFVVLATAPTAFAATPVVSPPSTPWTGTFTDVYYGGQFQLKQTGVSVTGSFSFCEGSLTGRVAGAELSGTWTQKFPCGGAAAGNGTFRFTMNDDLSGFTGTGFYASKSGDSPNFPWKGQRVGPPPSGTP